MIQTRTPAAISSSPVVVASWFWSSRPGASLKILPWPSSAAAASPSAVPAGHSMSPMTHLDVKPAPQV